MKDIRDLLIVILFFLISGCIDQNPIEGTAITNTTLIDAKNGVREHQTVIFQKDEILSVFPTNEDILNVATIIDGTDKFLIPGLWDMHVHLTFDDAFTEDMPALFLAHGITSIRDTGGLIEKLNPVVNAMRADNAIAPRVYFSGPLLDGKFVVYDGELVPEIGIQNATTEMANQKVSELEAAGVDFIKIYEMVSPEVFEALTDAAAKYELPIAAHVPLSMTASIAGPEVDSMEHLRNVELDCATNSPELYEERLYRLNANSETAGHTLRSNLHRLQRMTAIKNYDEERCNQTLDNLKSTIQVPTLRLNAFNAQPVYQRSDWTSILEKVPDEAKEKWITAAEDHQDWEDWDNTDFAIWSIDLVGRMNQRGIPIGAGTDTPIGYALPGFSLHTELEYLVEAGLTPIEALYAATVRPAEFFSIENEMGTIDAGKVADMVLLNANPIESISNTRQINLVVSKGAVILPETLLEL